jgi:hypothetical protein
MTSSLIDRVEAAVDHLDERLAERKEWLQTNLEFGKMLYALDAAARRIAQIEEERDDWRLRFCIAVDERNRAEARVAQSESLFDAALAGIDVKLARRVPGTARPFPKSRRVRHTNELDDDSPCAECGADADYQDGDRWLGRRCAGIPPAGEDDDSLPF